jgi:hypothetical protein
LRLSRAHVGKERRKAVAPRRVHRVSPPPHPPPCPICRRDAVALRVPVLGVASVVALAGAGGGACHHRCSALRARCIRAAHAGATARHCCGNHLTVVPGRTNAKQNVQPGSHHPLFANSRLAHALRRSLAYSAGGHPRLRRDRDEVAAPLRPSAGGAGRACGLAGRRRLSRLGGSVAEFLQQRPGLPIPNVRVSS